MSALKRAGFSSYPNSFFSSLATLGFLLSALALSSCTMTSSENGARPGSEKPAPPEELGKSCAEIITQAKIDAFNSQHQIAGLAGVRGIGQASCVSISKSNSRADLVQGAVAPTEHTSRSEGFAGLAAIASFKLGPSVSTESRLEIEIERAEITPEIANQIAEAFKAEKVDPRLIGRLDDGFASLALGDLPVVGVQIYRKGEYTGSRKMKIAFQAPPALASRFASQLADYEKGTAFVAIEFQLNRQSAVSSVASFKIGDSIHFKSLRHFSRPVYLAHLWERIVDLEAPALMGDLPYIWMEKARKALAGMDLKSTDAKYRLAPAWRHARGLWIPRVKSNDISAANQLEALRFVVSLDPENSLRPYLERVDKLEAIDRQDSDFVYDEAIRLVEEAPLKPERENLLFATASKLLKRHFGRKAWDRARTIVETLEYDQAKIDLVLAVETWIEKMDSAKSDRALDWVAKKELDSAGFERLKLARSWLGGFLSLAESLAKAERYIVDGKMNSEELELFKGMYGWLYSMHSSAVSLAKTEDYVIAKKLTREQCETLRATFQWLYANLSSTVALAKAELLVITHSLKKEQTDLYRIIYNWLFRTSSSSASHAKAEEYLLVRKITAEKFETLRAAYNKHYRTMSSAAALAMAEAEVFAAN